MIIKTLLFSVFLGLIILFYSCNNNTDEYNDSDNDILLDSNDVNNDHQKKIKMIFYNIPSPLEMATILQETVGDYNPEVLNPHNIYSKYTTNKKIALNLGIYGADLSYTRMFDQIQASVNYLSSIKKLSDNLGIPQNEGSFTVNRIEENIDNRDSILIIISETYAIADAYLKESGRGSTAALIIIGGWIEALYLATNMLKDNSDVNQEILNRIAEQKYSLENLVELSKSYKNNDDINEFLPQLEELQESFDKIEITYTKGEVITDEINKITTIKSKVNIDVSNETVIEIGIIVERIRSSIVE